MSARTSEKKAPPAKLTGQVRITAGVFKGKALSVPDGDAVRPTSDRVRQALFNRLEHSFQDYGFRLRGARVVDLFAGTGALGLEALSRGAAQVAFVEINPASRWALKHNIATLDVDDKVSLLTMDATALPAASQPYDLALLDPPYGEGLAEPAVHALAAKGWLTDTGLMVIEAARDETITAPDGWVIEDSRAYGRGALTYLVRKAPSATPEPDPKTNKIGFLAGTSP